MAEANLLRVERLEVWRRDAGGTPLVGPLDFDIPAGATGLVGESGSGKSLTARALMNLLPPNLRTSSQALRFDGQELSALDERGWRAWRGAKIALIMQDPRHALNPRLTLGAQIEEAMRLHVRSSKAQRLERVLAAMDEAGLPSPRALLGRYPHQLSGGMGQRVMLAIALINRPRLLIADEPTSALDADLRDRALERMMRCVETHGMGLLLISHDLPLIARHCRQALVMYRGRLVDRCMAGRFDEAASPYARALWQCRPGGKTHGRPLPTFHSLSATEQGT